MTRRVRITILSAIAIGVVLLAWLFLRSDEPVYKGKKLSYWLGGYDEFFSFAYPTQRKPTAVTPQNADEAVRAIGTNAMPMLLKMVRVRDAPLKMKLINWWRRKHPSSQMAPSGSFRYSFQASMAFTALGSNAVSAVPELIQIYTHDANVNVRRTAASCLGKIGPAASNAVPILIAGATSQVTNGVFTMQTIYALSGIRAPPEIFVPVLIHSLRDPYVGVQTAAVWTLGEMGTNALPAVSILADMYRASDFGAVRKPELKASLEQAIRKIDPKTAAELAVEEKTRF